MSKAIKKSDLRRRLKKADRRRESRRTAVDHQPKSAVPTKQTSAFGSLIECIDRFARTHSNVTDAAVVAALRSLLIQSPPSGEHSLPLYDQLRLIAVKCEASDRSIRDAVKELLEIAEDLGKNGDRDESPFLQYLSVICS